MRITGTIIPADQLYKAVDGKWVIAGTYNVWRVSDQDLYIQSGLNIYVRLITEHAGVVKGRFVFRNDAADPRVPSAGESSVPLLLTITPEMVPVAEARLHFGSFKVPGPPMESRRPDRFDVAKMTLILMLEDLDGVEYEVSKAPLTVVFTAPTITSGGDHERPNSDDRHGGDQ